MTSGSVFDASDDVQTLSTAPSAVVLLIKGIVDDELVGKMSDSGRRFWGKGIPVAPLGGNKGFRLVFVTFSLE